MSILKSTGRYPAITDLINSGGRLEVGYVYQLGVSAIALDEGGAIWEGKEHYETFEAALEDAEQGIAQWMAENC